jgi:selenoprotein W-related protein
MTQVDIEYCVPCGMRGRAVEVQEAVLEEFGQRVEAVSLVTGDNGIFEVRVDDELVFDKDDDEYDVDAIVEAVGERVGATA